jgi:hypothetical protein
VVNCIQEFDFDIGKPSGGLAREKLKSEAHFIAQTNRSVDLRINTGADAAGIDSVSG